MENRGGEPNEKLVEVFDTKQESEALVVKGLLESAGIEATLYSQEAPQDILPGVGGVSIQVREEDAETARRLIVDFRSDPGSNPDETESNQEFKDPSAA